MIMMTTMMMMMMMVAFGSLRLSLRHHSYGGLVDCFFVGTHACRICKYCLHKALAHPGRALAADTHAHKALAHPGRALAARRCGPAHGIAWLALWPDLAATPGMQI